jgi:PAS domain S-box-containing protein
MKLTLKSNALTDRGVFERIMEEKSLELFGLNKRFLSLKSELEEYQLKHERLVDELNEKKFQISSQLDAFNKSNITIEINFDRIILDVNDNFSKIFGYAKSEIIGKTYDTLINDSSNQRETQDLLWDSLRKGLSQEGEFLRLSKTGEDIWLSGSYSVILDSEGTPCRVLKIATDVTQSKNQLFELNQQIDAVNCAAVVYETDSMGNITFSNDLFCEISGYSSEELIGQNYSDIMWQAIRLGEVWSGSIINKSKTNSDYWLDITIVPFKNTEGEIYKYVTIGSETTRQKMLEIELSIQTDKLQFQQEKLQIANLELHGNTLKLKQSEDRLKDQQQELIKTNLDLSNSSKLLNERNQTLNDKNQELIRISQELFSKAEELELTSKYKSEFLANISHELRTPLNSIILLSQLLSENTNNKLDKDQLDYAAVIHNSGHILLKLIEEILDLSKIESGDFHVVLDTIDLEACCNSMENMFQPLAQKKSVDFSIEKIGDIPKNIISDEGRLEQVIRSLVSNAFKFTENGHVKIIVRLPNEKDINDSNIIESDFIIFEIIDSGIGIEKEKQGLIFEAFHQADGSIQRKYGGTGLGLSISHEIAQLLGGELTLESTFGEGSTFKLAIPKNSQGVIPKVSSHEKSLDSFEQNNNTSDASNGVALDHVKGESSNIYIQSLLEQIIIDSEIKPSK